MIITFEQEVKTSIFFKKAFGIAVHASVVGLLSSLPIQLKRSALTVVAKFGKFRPPLLVS